MAVAQNFKNSTYCGYIICLHLHQIIWYTDLVNE